MDKVQDTIHVNVEYYTDDEEYRPVYVASCEEIALTTDGRTFEELCANLGEAVELHLEGEDTVKAFNLTPNPRVAVSS